MLKLEEVKLTALLMGFTEVTCDTGYKKDIHYEKGDIYLDIYVMNNTVVPFVVWCTDVFGGFPQRIETMKHLRKRMSGSSLCSNLKN